jgi:aromatic-L-amino-acid decarboxylase
LSGDALDAHTLAWVGRINRSGEAFMSASILDGRWMVRVSIGVEATERHHVERLWQLIQTSAALPDA